MSFPSVHSDQQSTAFATIVSEALFSLYRDTYFSTLFGVCPTFRSRITAIILFFVFSVDSYFADARKTQEDTLKFFILSKIKGMQNNNTGGIECGTQTDIKYYNFEWRLNTDSTE